MGDIQFENSYEITKEKLKHWVSLSENRSGKHSVWLGLIFKIYMAVVIIIAWALTLKDREFLLLAMAITVLFGVILKNMLFSHSKIFKDFEKETGEAKWFQTTKFGEKIEISNASKTTMYDYDKIKFIEENDEAFYLWLDERIALRVYKNAFTLGNADEFRGFIYSKRYAIDSKPLWSKKEFDKKSFQKLVPTFKVVFINILIVAIFVVVSISGVSIGSHNVDKAIKKGWKMSSFVDPSTENFTIVECDGFAVAFGTDNGRHIVALLMKKSFTRYYAPVVCVRYTLEDGDEFFLSSKNTLQLKSGENTLVFGAVSSEYWGKNVSAETKAEYETVTFKAQEKSYVLYYKEAEND